LGLDLRTAKMNDADIHARLRALDEKLQHAEEQLKLKEPSNAGYVTTNLELRERYKALSEQVNRNVSAAENHGHRVSNLEYSVRMWLEGLDSGEI
jgi:hypothetical protein